MFKLTLMYALLFAMRTPTLGGSVHPILSGTSLMGLPSGVDLGERNYLQLIPNLAKVTYEQDTLTVPFTVKNVTNHDIAVSLDFGTDLDIFDSVDKSGNRKPISLLGGSTSYFVIVLKPGESHPCRFVCGFSAVKVPGETPTSTEWESMGMESHPRGKMVVAGIDGYVPSTNGSFTSYSKPFVFSPKFVTPPWTDLGSCEYLVVTPNKIEILGDNVFMPVSVKNISSQNVIPAVDHVGFYVDGNEHGRAFAKKQGIWDYFRNSQPVLKPSESAGGSPRDCVSFSWLREEGFKDGDKIVAMVGGKIAGTNKIFESYSAPFELPPLPK